MKIILLTALILFLSNSLHSQGQWRLVLDEAGIKVYNRPVTGSDVDEFKGIMTVNSPINDVIRVLQDIPSHTKWRANCIESSIIKKYSDYDMIIYNVTKAPPPLDYRDVVLKVNTEFSPDRKKVIISMNALESPLVPLKKNYVRLKELHGQWVLESLSANRTRITYTVRSNPGGNIPAFIANMASKKLPFNTLKGLRFTLTNKK